MGHVPHISSAREDFGLWLCESAVGPTGLSRSLPHVQTLYYKILVWISSPQSEMKNNFWQRISWLSQRWRTQRIAISNVNCRIQWIIKSLNAHCALWYSGEHACLRIDKTLTCPSLFGTVKVGRCASVDLDRLWISESTMILNEMSTALVVLNKAQSAWMEFERTWSSRRCFVQRLTCCVPNHYIGGCIPVGVSSKNLVSNQVGKPAELKHINKRRKRN